MKHLLTRWSAVLADSGVRPVDHLYGVAVCAVLLFDAAVLWGIAQ